MFKNISALMATLLVATTSLAWEPTKPVTAVIGMPAGSAMDVAFRIVATQVEKNTGVKFVPNYRPGAGGTIAAEFVSRASEDGYTLLTATSAGLVGTDRMVVPNKTFGTQDFVFAVGYASTTMSIIAHPDDPVNSVQDLVKVLRSEKTTVGDPGAGARLTYEILRESLKFEERIDQVVRVDYKGPVETLTDVISKNIRFGIVPVATSAQAHLGNKVKIIAVTSDAALPSLPNIPVVSSLNPNAVFNLSWLVTLPKNTPPSVVQWYNREFSKALQSKDVQQALEDQYFFIDKKLIPTNLLTAKILSDEKKYQPLVDKVLAQRK
jgi:tripartite-type tricarboxylate transporter receptor subunit TctC